MIPLDTIYEEFLEYLDDIDLLQPRNNESNLAFEKRMALTCESYFKKAVVKCKNFKNKIIVDFESNSILSNMDDTEMDILKLYMVREYYRKKLNRLLSNPNSYSDKDWKAHSKDGMCNQYRQTIKEIMQEIEELEVQNTYYEDGELRVN